MNSKSVWVSMALAAACAGAQVPEVGSVSVSQDTNTRAVTIHYTLTGAPGIVTIDVRTNGVSIGAENITCLSGDVNKLVTELGSARTITWLANKSWPEHKIVDQSASVEVTAWATDAPPDYLVADLNAGTNIQYYTSAAALPGGGLSNAMYKTSRLVMRRIHAAGIPWTMGSTMETFRSKNETAHPVTLASDYYIGVYELTQAQWAALLGDTNKPSYFTNEGDRACRPVERISYICDGEIRASLYPAAPAPTSFLGLLRAKTGLAFDLPGEAQWEYACRAGNGEGKWGDGSGYQGANTDTNLEGLGRYRYDGGYAGSTYSTYPAASCSAENGTAVVGSYAPNSWGLYDMHGNVREICQDVYADDITALGGAVNTNGTTASNHVVRGGAWSDAAPFCRSADRESFKAREGQPSVGFRVAIDLGR